MITRRPITHPAPGRKPAPGSGWWRGPQVAGGAARAREERPLIYFFTRLSWFSIASLLGIHLVLGAEPFPLAARAFCAVPGVLFFIEARTYLKSEQRELPFILLALAQFYLQFGLPVLWELPFFDATGPVFFSETTRVEGSLAVALGAVTLWGFARFGLRPGERLRRSALKILPPETLPDAWDTSFYVYAGATVTYAFLTIAFPTMIPVSLMLAVNLLLDSTYAIGLAAVRPPRLLGRRSTQVLLLIGMVTGMLRGQLEPIARTVVAYLGAQWVATRRAAMGALAVMVALYLVLQPLKNSYRSQVWLPASRGEDVGFTGRVNAWQSSFSNTDSYHRRADDQAMSRLTELSAVMNALVVVPSRVDYMYGTTYLEIFYAPIPRLLWPDKPETRQRYSQRYAVIFGLQTEAGSERTAFNLNPLVEGYWNLGWFGIVVSCAAMGLLVGAQQRLFSGSHWALLAGGVAQLGGLSVTGSATLMYSVLFQYVVARVGTAWGIYWLARNLSSRRARGGVPRGLTMGAPPPNPRLKASRSA